MLPKAEKIFGIYLKISYQVYDFIENMTFLPYPWQQKNWEDIDFLNVPQSVLISGQEGIGKFNFAIHLAKALLCETSTGQKPCGACDACHWFDKGNHPDFVLLLPESLQHLSPAQDANEEPVPKSSKSEDEKAEKKASLFIKVEAIRDAIDEISNTTHRGGHRVILISPVEALQSVSANTLLKSLEEPPPGTIFILVTHRLDRVLPTIRSRCRILTLSRPDHELAKNWLKDQLKAAGQSISESVLDKALHEAGGAVMTAYLQLTGAGQSADQLEQSTSLLLEQLAEGGHLDWLGVSEKIAKTPMPILLQTVQRWIADLMCLKLGQTIRYYPDRQNVLLSCANQLDAKRLSNYWDSITQRRKYELHPLAHRLQLEAILLRYVDLFKH